MRITCKTKGVQEVIANLKKYDDDTQQRIGVVVNTSLKNIAKGARSRLPQSKTGNLRKGLKKKYSKKAIGGTVTSNAPHSHLIEFGVKPHIIRAKNKKELSSDGEIFGKEVMHPGSKPRPFMQPAYYQERSNYIENLKKAVKPD